MLLTSNSPSFHSAGAHLASSFAAFQRISSRRSGRSHRGRGSGQGLSKSEGDERRDRGNNRTSGITCKRGSQSDFLRNSLALTSGTALGLALVSIGSLELAAAAAVGEFPGELGGPGKRKSFPAAAPPFPIGFQGPSKRFKPPYGNMNTRGRGLGEGDRGRGCEDWLRAPLFLPEFGDNAPTLQVLNQSQGQGIAWTNGATGTSTPCILLGAVESTKDDRKKPNPLNDNLAKGVLSIARKPAGMPACIASKQGSLPNGNSSLRSMERNQITDKNWATGNNTVPPLSLLLFMGQLSHQGACPSVKDECKQRAAASSERKGNAATNAIERKYQQDHHDLWISSEQEFQRERKQQQQQQQHQQRKLSQGDQHQRHQEYPQDKQGSTRGSERDDQSLRMDSGLFVAGGTNGSVVFCTGRFQASSKPNEGKRGSRGGREAQRQQKGCRFGNAQEDNDIVQMDCHSSLLQNSQAGVRPNQAAIAACCSPSTKLPSSSIPTVQERGSMPRGSTNQRLSPLRSPTGEEGGRCLGRCLSLSARTITTAPDDIVVAQDLPWNILGKVPALSKDLSVTTVRDDMPPTMEDLDGKQQLIPDPVRANQTQAHPRGCSDVHDVAQCAGSALFWALDEPEPQSPQPDDATTASAPASAGGSLESINDDDSNIFADATAKFSDLQEDAQGEVLQRKATTTEAIVAQYSPKLHAELREHSPENRGMDIERGGTEALGASIQHVSAEDNDDAKGMATETTIGLQHSPPQLPQGLQHRGGIEEAGGHEEDYHQLEQQAPGEPRETDGFPRENQDTTGAGHVGSLAQLVLQGRQYGHVSAHILSFLPTKTRHQVARTCKLWDSRISFSLSKTLDLSDQNNISDDVFARLMALYTNVTDAKLSGCAKLTNTALRVIANRHSGSLKTLDLSRMPMINDEGLGALAGCGDLERLWVVRSDLITNSGVSNLAMRCPKLIPPIIMPKLTRQRGFYWATTSRRPMERAIPTMAMPAMPAAPSLSRGTSKASVGTDLPPAPFLSAARSFGVGAKNM